nr:restriction endonuclease subunit S [uncultured Carboxylicivirga sp.]
MGTVELKYRKYGSYKDSGIKWIGEIPEDWKIESFKNILTERNEKNDPVRSHEILSLSIGKGVTLYAEKTTNLDRFKDDVSKYKLAYKGDLVFNSMNMIVGAVGVSNYFGCVSPVYYTYYGRLNNSYTTFYEYLFRCKTVQGVLYSLGRGLMAIDRGDGKYNTLRLKISRDDLRSFRLPFPNISVQTAIANFLDNKTANIDTAIAQKEKMIALLKEQKQIMIQNSVTKGLNPNANMKDSGVEWIGKIPVGWELRPLKHIASINKQSLPENTSKVHMFDYVDIGSVSYTNGIEKTERFSFKDSPSRARRIACSGNTIISTVRTYLKAIDFVSEEKSSFIYSTGFAILQPIIIHDKFLYHFVRSDAFTEQVTVNSTGMSYPAINSTDLGKLWVAVPPKEEQTQIVTYIETQSTKIDNAIALQQTQIEKLKEYKAILIDSAVTGKIKVTE